jgi:hypothetical protein
MDIGAYDCGYRYLKRRGFDGDVIFMNSSVSGPDRDGWLSDYSSLFHSHPALGVVGISMNSHDTNRGSPEFDPHVQSFFLYSSMDRLKEVFPRHLPETRRGYQKLDLIAKGEIGISREMLRAGYGIACRAFGDDVYFSGDLWKWERGDPSHSKELRGEANKI